MLAVACALIYYLFIYYLSIDSFLYNVLNTECFMVDRALNPSGENITTKLTTKGHYWSLWSARKSVLMEVCLSMLICNQYNHMCV